MKEPWRLAGAAMLAALGAGMAGREALRLPTSPIGSASSAQLAAPPQPRAQAAMPAPVAAPSTSPAAQPPSIVWRPLPITDIAAIQQAARSRPLEAQSLARYLLQTRLCRQDCVQAVPGFIDAAGVLGLQSEAMQELAALMVLSDPMAPQENDNQQSGLLVAAMDTLLESGQLELAIQLLDALERQPTSAMTREAIAGYRAGRARRASSDLAIAQPP